jgi:DNA polymerase III alpha subunit
MGLRLLLPDVNRSGRDYDGRGREIRMGLMAFVGLAESAIDNLLDARRRGGPFTNLSDLLARSGVGRADLELLVRGGACDGFELTRPELLWRLACRSGAGDAADLFPGAGGLDHLVPRLPEYVLAERCRMEEEIFGFPVTRHPLELLPEDPSLAVAADLLRLAGRRVRMRGLAISYKRIPTKAGAWMKFLSLEDLTGTFEAVLFPDTYARYAEATLGTGPFLLEGRVEVDHAVASLTVERLTALGGAAAGTTGRPARDRVY